MAQQLSHWGKRLSMKGKYVAAASAAGVALIGLALYYFLGRRKDPVTVGPQKESERHHLTTAFAKAKQVAIGRS